MTQKIYIYNTSVDGKQIYSCDKSLFDFGMRIEIYLVEVVVEGY